MAICNWSHLQSTRAKVSDCKKVTDGRLIKFLNEDGRTKKTVASETEHPVTWGQTQKHHLCIFCC